MKPQSTLLRRISLLLFSSFLCLSSFAQQLFERLKSENIVQHLEVTQSADQREKLLCTITQQVDWQNPDAGTFEQRLVLKHRGFDKPTVMVTEGYGGHYAWNAHYEEELCELLDANLVFVQHRYFLESTPQPCQWDYLTVENSAGDYHHIRTLLGKIYTGKWFTTGISKGGQTTLFYRTYYPNDVDGSVAYVAPLNRSVEDGRHEPFLERIDDQGATAKIREFQKEVLQRRNILQPFMEALCQKKRYKFRRPFSEIFDLCVLEYEFAYWQWGNSPQSIPSANASNEDLLKSLISVCDPSYFTSESDDTPFFVQALREIGYYGYDVKPLQGYLSIPNAEGYLRRTMVSEPLSHIEFDPTLYEKVKHFLQTADVPMIFIYGENDPWTATGVTRLEGKQNMHVFIEPGGSHLARIGTMPEETQKEIKSILKRWLKK